MTTTARTTYLLHSLSHDRATDSQNALRWIVASAKDQELAISIGWTAGEEVLVQAHHYYTGGHRDPMIAVSSPSVPDRVRCTREARKALAQVGVHVRAVAKDQETHAGITAWVEKALQALQSSLSVSWSYILGGVPSTAPAAPKAEAQAPAAPAPAADPQVVAAADAAQAAQVLQEARTRLARARRLLSIAPQDRAAQAQVAEAEKALQALLPVQNLQALPVAQVAAHVQTAAALVLGEEKVEEILGGGPSTTPKAGPVSLAPYPRPLAEDQGERFQAQVVEARARRLRADTALARDWSSRAAQEEAVAAQAALWILQWGEDPAKAQADAQTLVEDRVRAALAEKAPAPAAPSFSLVITPQGEAPFQATLQDLEEDVAQVAARLLPGQTVQVGGGAADHYTITRPLEFAQAPAAPPAAPQVQDPQVATAQDAHDRVLQARTGSLVPQASQDYLDALLRDVKAWEEEIRTEIGRRVRAAQEAALRAAQDHPAPARRAGLLEID